MRKLRLCQDLMICFITHNVLRDSGDRDINELSTQGLMPVMLVFCFPPFLPKFQALDACLVADLLYPYYSLQVQIGEDRNATQCDWSPYGLKKLFLMSIDSISPQLEEIRNSSNRVELGI